MGAITANDVGGLAGFHRPVVMLQPRHDAVGRLVEIEQFPAPLDLNTIFGESIDQQPLVLVLRKDQNVRIRTDPSTHLAKRGASHPTPGNPQIDAGRRAAMFDDAVRDPDLPVQLQGSRLHRERPRCCRGFRRLVDDSRAHAQPGEPQPHDQAGGPGADNEDVRVAHHRSYDVTQE